MAHSTLGGLSSTSSSSLTTAFTRAELAGHKARLASIRPRIDFSTPSSYFVLLNRAKKEQQLSEWAQGVDAANLALLSRMTSIHTAQRAAWDDHAERVEERERRKREQSDADRAKEQKRIDDENRLLLDRIRAQRSAYGTHTWLSHAQAYEKHLKEVRLRQLLIHDPLHARELIREEKERERQRRAQKRRTRKLKPLSSAGEASYERDPDVDAAEAADAAEQSEQTAREAAEVAAFDEVDAADLLDQQTASGALSLSEFIAPRGQSEVLLHQDGHTIDGRHVILSVHEVNRATARTDVSVGEWTAFTAVPPDFLHAFLVRSYDLDRGLHCHLYLPFAPMRALGKGDRRLQRIIALLGFTERGELFFRQSLMPQQPQQQQYSAGRAAVAEAKAKARTRGREAKAEEKQQEDRLPQQQQPAAKPKPKPQSPRAAPPQSSRPHSPPQQAAMTAAPAAARPQSPPSAAAAASAEAVQVNAAEDTQEPATESEVEGSAAPAERSAGEADEEEERYEPTPDHWKTSNAPTPAVLEPHSRRASTDVALSFVDSDLDRPLTAINHGTIHKGAEESKTADEPAMPKLAAVREISTASPRSPARGTRAAA